MALPREKVTNLNKPAEPARPLFERIQEGITRLDVGLGVQWLRLGMFCLIVLTVILFYTGTQFYGLRDPEVMDLGQLGRNLARGRGYVTKFIRPVELGYLNAAGKLSIRQGREVLPELWTPPVYPWVLSVFFRVYKPQIDLSDAEKQLQLQPQQLPPADDWSRLELLYTTARGQALRIDRALVIVAWLCFLVSLAVLYWLARELFDHRVAMLSVVLYLVCDSMLDACISGAPLAFLALLFMLAVGALLKAEQWSESKSSVYWTCGALAVCGLMVGIGTLTQYTFASVLLPLAVYLVVSLPRLKWYVKIGFVFGVFVLTVLPWIIRNEAVSDTSFGLARLAVKQPAQVGVGSESAELQWLRSFETPGRFSPRRATGRMLVNWNKLYRESVKDTGANYMMAFFLVSLLHRFKREDVLRLRQYVLWALVATLLWLGLAGVPKRNVLTVFIPLIIVYGSAFFFVLFERLQFRARWIRRGTVGLFVVLNGLPFLFTILPPAPLAPYPPYDGGVAAVVGNAFREDDLLVSDVPWALAWYGDRSAVLIPEEETVFTLKINDNLHVISGIYMTPLTLSEMRMADLATGQAQFWLGLYSPPAAKFPLQFSRVLTPDRQQVLLSNRSR